MSIGGQRLKQSHSQPKETDRSNNARHGQHCQITGSGFKELSVRPLAIQPLLLKPYAIQRTFGEFLQSKPPQLLTRIRGPFGAEFCKHIATELVIVVSTIQFNITDDCEAKRSQNGHIDSLSTVSQMDGDTSREREDSAS